MTDINTLINIANALGLKEKAALLQLYKDRLNTADSDLVVPLVGEFSSGKTSLINALLDKPGLETATRATTASIFEVRFGADECFAEIVDDRGNATVIDDITTLKNDGLDASVVRVYDTSTRVGVQTVLVDTPGLSSSDPNHQIALSSYLPNADAILVLTDINQQLTRTTIDFINTSRLAGRPIYGVITKSDTKTADEIEQARDYMKSLPDVKFDDIIAISSATGDLKEFDSLIAKLQANKSQIVERSVKSHISEIAAEMADIVRQMMASARSTDDIDAAIADEEQKLRNINRNIDMLMAETADKLDEHLTKSMGEFRKMVFTQIDAIVKTSGRECDNEVHMAVNNAGAIVLQNFQRDVLSEIVALARKRKNRNSDVPTDMLETVCIADRAFNGFTYDIDLASAGHKNDKSIGYGVLAVTAVVTIAVTGGVAAAAAGGSATSTGVVLAANASTDAAAAAYTAHKINKLSRVGRTVARTAQLANDVKTGMEVLHASSDKMGQKMGMKRGFLETTVGWVTEFFAKPQRQRAVAEYVDTSLTPEFHICLSNASTSLLHEIEGMLRRESENQCEQITDNLRELRATLDADNLTYQKRIDTLTSYLDKLQDTK